MREKEREREARTTMRGVAIRARKIKRRVPFGLDSEKITTFPPWLPFHPVSPLSSLLSVAISSFILAAAHGRMLIFEDGFPPPPPSSLRFTIIGTTFPLPSL